MKKIIYLFVLLLALPSLAQERQNTIVVIGESEKEVLAGSYTIIITLQDVTVYEGQGEIVVTPLDIVEQNFTKKLKDSGIDFNRFKRNSYYEFVMSYSQGKESACYYLKTSDEAEVRKIMQLKSAGMSIATIDIEPITLTDTQLVGLSIKAIANAKAKAEAIADKMNKTIGEIVMISDPNPSLHYIQSYGTTTTQVHSVTVSFELL